MSDKNLESWMKPDVEYLDFEPSLTVVCAGRVVPHLTASRINNEFTGFRFAIGDHGIIDCNIDDAPHLVWAVAHSLAVGAGYVGWPPSQEDEFIPRPFAPRITGITLPPAVTEETK